jgi:L-rhamnose mutarotase
MRVALHSIIREGAEVDYEKHHETIPDDLVQTFDRVGIESWTIWRSGRDLFHVVVADDFAAAEAQLAVDPANQRWQATIGPFVERFIPGDDAGSPALPRVWDFETQKADGVPQ